MIAIKLRRLLCLLCLFTCGLLRAEKITIAAASDLRFVMDVLISTYHHENPQDVISVVYGSSGKFFAQIKQGADYDLFFSADVDYPKQLIKAGFASSEVYYYGLGRLVIWQHKLNASAITLTALTHQDISYIAIANPKHAPYGIRAEQALKNARIFPNIKSRLVYAENIMQTVQLVKSGNAQVGIIALSLALAPDMSRVGSYSLIPATLHDPLQQGFIITSVGARRPLSKKFATFVQSPTGKHILKQYGFESPGGMNVFR